jgi:hypothetical protein
MDTLGGKGAMYHRLKLARLLVIVAMGLFVLCTQASAQETGAKDSVADSYHNKALNLYAQSPVDKNGKVLVSPEAIEALQTYLILDPHGKHAEAAKAFLQFAGAPEKPSGAALGKILGKLAGEGKGQEIGAAPATGGSQTSSGITSRSAQSVPPKAPEAPVPAGSTWNPTENITGSAWACPMRWSTIWDGRPFIPFDHSELVTFKEGGLLSIVSILADGKSHPEDKEGRPTVMEDDRWSQNGSSIKFTLGASGLLFQGSRVGPDQIKFSVSYYPPDPRGISNGNFVCTKYARGSGKEWAPFPPLELSPATINRQTIRMGESVTIFFGIHDPRPDKPIRWEINAPAGFTVTAIGPPDSGEFRHQVVGAAPSGAGGSVPSGAYIGVTFKLVNDQVLAGLRDDSVVTFTLLVWKEELVGGEKVEVNLCNKPGYCPIKFPVKYIH